MAPATRRGRCRNAPHASTGAVGAFPEDQGQQYPDPAPLEPLGSPEGAFDDEAEETSDEQRQIDRQLSRPPPSEVGDEVEPPSAAARTAPQGTRGIQGRLPSASRLVPRSAADIFDDNMEKRLQSLT